MNEVLIGAIAMGLAAAGLYFLRFWKRTHDRLFLYFAASFWLESINRLYLGLSESPSEGDPIHYAVRLVSYGLILVAIAEKNAQRKGSPGDVGPR